MRIRFRSKKLKALYDHEQDAHKYDHGVVDAFFEVVAMIEAAKDERDMRALASLHFEKLKGNRQGQRSIRLVRQWRLIVELGRDEQGNLVVVVDIVDYH